MVIRLIQPLLALGLLLGSLVSCSPAYADTLYEHMRQSVVEVGNKDGLGSGVIIGPSTILTAAHVVDNGEHLRIQFYGSSFEIFGKATTIRKDMDLAIITIDIPKDLKAVPVNCSPVTLGQHLNLMGFPIGLPWVLTQGYVASDIPPDKNGQLLMDVRTNHGNSGGPVFNDKGEVVGIALAEVGMLPDKERGIGNTLGMFLPTSKFCSELKIKGVN